MRPNTPHYVLGVENSIVLGRHFYSTAAISDSYLGIIHSSILGLRITNQRHSESVTFLRRLMTMWADHFCAGSLRFGKQGQFKVHFRMTSSSCSLCSQACAYARCADC